MSKMVFIKHFTVVLLLQSVIQHISVGELMTSIFRRDYTFIQETESFYKIHADQITWQKAKEKCVKEGTNLFYPENDKEADAVIRFWNQTQPYHWVYIGISSLSTKGVFQTIDGRPITDVYSKWGPGEPNDSNADENCVILHRDGTLNDDSCARECAFICKKSQALQKRKPLCDSSDLQAGPFSTSNFRTDYTFIPETKSYYKMHTKQSSWEEAKEKCIMEGTFLFYPENDQESDAVIRFWNQTQPHHWIFIGISSLSNKGIFKTIDGRPITDIYSNWGPGEPNDANGEENCVIFHRDGTLNDDNCARKWAFICKKPQESIKKKPICNTPDLTTELTPSHSTNTIVTETLPTNFFRKDYTYIPETESFYKIHTIHSIWQEAKKKCAMEGAKLFYPESDQETNAVISFWNKKQPYSSVYIGISSLLSKGVFETIDGRPITDVFSNWGYGEPNDNNGEEDCVILYSNGTLNDENCSKKLPFICKKTQALLEWNLLCDIPDLSYTYNEVQEKCYKLHVVPMNWTDAYSVCSTEQSYLAIINSQSESDLLIRMAEAAPKDKIRGNYLTDVFHLGYRNVEEGWKNIKGQTLEDSGYDKWGSGQPDGKDQEKCGSMFYNGQLNDITCDTKCFFICEHDIGSLSDSLDERFSSY